jgi:hypothetical protein
MILIIIIVLYSVFMYMCRYCADKLPVLTTRSNFILISFAKRLLDRTNDGHTSVAAQITKIMSLLSY